jgi:hypothetical protein
MKKSLPFVKPCFTLPNMKTALCGFRCEPEFKNMVVQRAASLGMTPSQYVVLVLREDIKSGRPNLNVIAESKPEYHVKKKGGAK